MAEVPITFQGMMYPKNKTVPPYAFTALGMASITGLQVGGGPIEPPPDIVPEPPLVIWGGGGVGDHIDWIMPYPPDGPPDPPPTQVQKPHEGWNWSVAKAQWYYLYVPGEGVAQPKKR